MSPEVFLKKKKCIIKNCSNPEPPVSVARMIVGDWIFEDTIKELGCLKAEKRICLTEERPFFGPYIFECGEDNRYCSFNSHHDPEKDTLEKRLPCGIYRGPTLEELRNTRKEFEEKYDKLFESLRSTKKEV